MLRGKFDYPDLDVLDSPLLSSTPFTSSFLGVPGSAIAENIFNDPDSWEKNDNADVAPDPLAWLTEGMEKFKANSADVYGAFDPAVPDKRNPVVAPAGEMQSGSTSIHRACNIRPISIPRFPHDEDIQVQLSKILDASGIPHHIYPLSSALSPPSFTEINYYPPLKVNTSTVAGSAVDSPSPLDVHSSSITMCFLEWYGVYPELDLNRCSLRQKSVNPVTLPPPKRDIPPSPPPVRDTLSNPAEKLNPPPGLEPPQHLPRFRSHSLTRSEIPPYTPGSSRPRSQSRSWSSSNSRSQSPSSHNSNGRTGRRRLPSIPVTETFSSSLPPSGSSPMLPSTELPGLVSQPSSRCISSVRSPPVGPAGPRTRASSRVGQDSITSLPQTRPPILRL